MELSLKAKLENRWSGAGYVCIPVKSQPAEEGIRLGEKWNGHFLLTVVENKSSLPLSILLKVSIGGCSGAWDNNLLVSHKHIVTGFRSEMEPRSRLLRKPPTNAWLDGART